MLNRIQYGGSPAWYRHTPFRASPTFFVITLSPIMPIATQAEELRNESSHPLGHRIPDELQLLQEEPVSVAGYSEQTLQQAPAHVYVTTDKDIRDFSPPTSQRSFVMDRVSKQCKSPVLPSTSTSACEETITHTRRSSR
jgi:Predicted dinucleotide-utilizing enzyme of the ThiF/HesA family